MSIRFEFCGVPGSGKSTLCEGAVRLLHQRGRPVSDRISMVDTQLKKRNFGWIANTLSSVVPGWREAFLSLPHGMDDWIHFVSMHPDFTALIHAWQAEPGLSEFWRRMVFHAVVTTAFEFELAAGESGEVLLDEGFAQRFFSLRGYDIQARDGDAEQYAEVMPLPSALIWVDTDPEICFERLKRRPRLPVLIQNDSEEALPDLLARGSSLLETLASAMERRHLRVLRIRGDGDVESTVVQIANFVEKYS